MFKNKIKTYIIAEIGINFSGKFSNIIKLINQAKKSGADAVKFQLFKANTLSNKQISKSNYNMWKKMELNNIHVKKIKNICKQKKIDLFFSVFDELSLDILKKNNIKNIKIASSEVNNIYLLKKISKFAKNVILSTGMATENEIIKSCKIFNKLNLGILHCVSLYPTPDILCNLNRMINLQKKFKKIPVGYSDHQIGIDACLLAISKEAKIIEKHFTYNKNLIGADHNISADYIDLKRICDYRNKTFSLMGSGKITPSLKERKNKFHFRKGLYAKQLIKKSQKIKANMIELRRPANSFPIEKLEKYINLKAKREIQNQQKIRTSDFNKN